MLRIVILYIAIPLIASLLESLPLGSTWIALLLGAMTHRLLLWRENRQALINADIFEEETRRRESAKQNLFSALLYGIGALIWLSFDFIQSDYIPQVLAWTFTITTLLFDGFYIVSAVRRSLSNRIRKENPITPKQPHGFIHKLFIFLTGSLYKEPLITRRVLAEFNLIFLFIAIPIVAMNLFSYETESNKGAEHLNYVHVAAQELCKTEASQKPDQICSQIDFEHPQFIFHVFAVAYQFELLENIPIILMDKQLDGGLYKKLEDVNFASEVLMALFKLVAVGTFLSFILIYLARRSDCTELYHTLNSSIFLAKKSKKDNDFYELVIDENLPLFKEKLFEDPALASVMFTMYLKTEDERTLFERIENFFGGLRDSIFIKQEEKLIPDPHTNALLLLLVGHNECVFQNVKGTLHKTLINGYVDDGVMSLFKSIINGGSLDFSGSPDKAKTSELALYRVVLDYIANSADDLSFEVLKESKVVQYFEDALLELNLCYLSERKPDSTNAELNFKNDQAKKELAIILNELFLRYQSLMFTEYQSIESTRELEHQESKASFFETVRRLERLAKAISSCDGQREELRRVSSAILLCKDFVISPNVDQASKELLDHLQEDNNDDQRDILSDPTNSASEYSVRNVLLDIACSKMLQSIKAGELNHTIALTELISFLQPNSGGATKVARVLNDSIQGLENRFNMAKLHIDQLRKTQNSDDLYLIFSEWLEKDKIKSQDLRNTLGDLYERSLLRALTEDGTAHFAIRDFNLFIRLNLVQKQQKDRRKELLKSSRDIHSQLLFSAQRLYEVVNEESLKLVTIEVNESDSEYVKDIKQLALNIARGFVLNSFSMWLLANQERALFDLEMSAIEQRFAESLHEDQNELSQEDNDKLFEEFQIKELKTYQKSRVKRWKGAQTNESQLEIEVAISKESDFESCFDHWISEQSQRPSPKLEQEYQIKYLKEKLADLVKRRSKSSKLITKIMASLHGILKQYLIKLLDEPSSDLHRIFIFSPPSSEIAEKLFDNAINAIKKNNKDTLSKLSFLWVFLLSTMDESGIVRSMLKQKMPDLKKVINKAKTNQSAIEFCRAFLIPTSNFLPIGQAQTWFTNGDQSIFSHLTQPALDQIIQELEKLCTIPVQAYFENLQAGEFLKCFDLLDGCDARSDRSLLWLLMREMLHRFPTNPELNTELFCKISSRYADHILTMSDLRYEAWTKEMLDKIATYNNTLHCRIYLTRGHVFSDELSHKAHPYVPLLLDQSFGNIQNLSLGEAEIRFYNELSAWLSHEQADLLKPKILSVWNQANLNLTLHDHLCRLTNKIHWSKSELDVIKGQALKHCKTRNNFNRQKIIRLLNLSTEFASGSFTPIDHEIANLAPWNNAGVNANSFKNDLVLLITSLVEQHQSGAKPNASQIHVSNGLNSLLVDQDSNFRANWLIHPNDIGFNQLKYLYTNIIPTVLTQANMKNSFRKLVTYSLETVFNGIDRIEKALASNAIDPKLVQDYQDRLERYQELYKLIQVHIKVKLFRYVGDYIAFKTGELQKDRNELISRFIPLCAELDWEETRDLLRAIIAMRQDHIFINLLHTLTSTIKDHAIEEDKPWLVSLYRDLSFNYKNLLDNSPFKKKDNIRQLLSSVTNIIVSLDKLSYKRSLGYGLNTFTAHSSHISIQENIYHFGNLATEGAASAKLFQKVSKRKGT